MSKSKKTKKKITSLSKLKFDKKAVLSNKELKKLIKDIENNQKEIDNKRKVDWEKLSRTYITK